MFAFLLVLFLFFSAVSYPSLSQADTPSRDSSLEETSLPHDVAPSEPAPAEVVPLQTFKINKVNVTGNAILRDDEIAAMVAPYEGREVTLEDLQKAAAQIQEIYRNKGYFLATAYLPAQELENGVLRMDILEGRLGDTHIQGESFYSNSFIFRNFAPVKKGDVLRYEPFQRSVLLLNEFMDLDVKSVFQPGKEEGTADIVLEVKGKRPLHVSVDYNNFGSRFVGENRAGLSVTAGNVGMDGDQVSLRGVLAFPADSDTPFLQGTYQIPIPPWRFGQKLTLAYANSEMAPGKELAILDIRGKSDVYSLTLSHPLRRTTVRSSDLSVGLSSQSAQKEILGVPSSHDELRTLDIGYQFNRVTEKARHILSVSLSQGLGTALGGMEKHDPMVSRPGAGNAFTVLNLEAVRVQNILSNYFLFLRAGGQLASDSLVVMKQYTAGGSDSVRGFPQSESAGDQGYAVSAELRMPLNVKALSWKGYPDTIQAAFFVDHGLTSLKGTLPGEKGTQQLTGGGLGLRMGAGDWLSARLDLGFPLDPHTTLSGLHRVVYVQIAAHY